jgi:hypothetical protein
VGDYDEYLNDLVNRFWSYRSTRFSNEQTIFDQSDRRDMRPPVFSRDHALRNVLVDPQLSQSEAHQVCRMLSPKERHRWFGSMKSSQALVQSVFGNLCALKLCSALEMITTDEGSHPFHGISPDGASLTLEMSVTTLGEPRPTSIDISVQGPLNIAIECKLAESDVGHCSRPNMNEDDPDHCDGSYRSQHSRRERCALTALGIKYWNFIPRLFTNTWRADQDHVKCPLRSTYQLVRNVLAASIGDGGEVVPGFAVLLFDDRNPEFQKDGAGGRAFAAVKDALIEPERLQRVSWQTIMQTLRNAPRLQWLNSELAEKYGL